MRERGAQLRFDRVGNLVRVQQGHRPVHLDMQLDERGRPGAAGADVVHGGHLGMALGDPAHAGALGIGQFAVHQLRQ